MSLLKCTLAPSSMASNSIFPGVLEKWLMLCLGQECARQRKMILLAKKARKLSKFMGSCQSHTRANQNCSIITESLTNTAPLRGCLDKLPGDTRGPQDRVMNLKRCYSERGHRIHSSSPHLQL